MEVSWSLAARGEEGSVGVAPRRSPCLSWEAGLAEPSLQGVLEDAAPWPPRPCQQPVGAWLCWVNSPPSPRHTRSPRRLPCAQTCSWLLSDRRDAAEPARTRRQLSAGQVWVAEGSLQMPLVGARQDSCSETGGEKAASVLACQSCPCKQAHVSFPLKHRAHLPARSCQDTACLRPPPPRATTHRGVVRAGMSRPASPLPIPAPLSALRKTGFDAAQAVEAGSSVCLALGIELVEINKIKF